MRTWFSGGAVLMSSVAAIQALAGIDTVIVFRALGYAGIFALLAIAWAPKGTP